MQEERETSSTQYLTFTLAEEFFAVDIGKVREVLDYTTVTRIPGTPPFMLGVINLRGRVVPVMDMRLRFGMPAADMSVNTCIIIVEVEVNGESMVLGAMADSVQEVLDLDADQIEPPPQVGTMMDVAYISGIGKRDDQFVIILDIDRIFSACEELMGHVALAEPVMAVNG